MLQGWTLQPPAHAAIFVEHRGRGHRRPSRPEAGGLLGTFRMSHPGDSEMHPYFFISVWLPRALREFFISVIILPLLKAGKISPRDRGLELPLNCSPSS